MSEKLTREERNKLVREETKDYVKKAYMEGKMYSDVSRNRLPINGNILKNSVNHHFRNIVELCRILNIPEKDFISKRGITNYYAGLISKNDVDYFIKKVHEGYSDGRYAKDVVNGEDGEIEVLAAKRVYGSWEMALYRNGIRPPRILDKGLKKEIESKVVTIYKEVKTLRHTSEKVGVSEKIVRDILDANSIEINDTSRWYLQKKPPLSKGDTERFILEIIEKSVNERITVDKLTEKHPYEAFSIRYHFGSIIKGIKHSGEYTLDKWLPKEWDDEYIIEQIELGYRLGKELNIEYMNRGAGASAVTYARSSFGSWKNAVERAGIPYENVSKASKLNMDCGRDFELILDDIFLEVGINYKKEFHDVYKPDYVVGDHWYDAKLSEYTYTGRDKKGDTLIDNYEPHCERLTIVFLIGNEGTDRMLSSKTRLVHVSHYLEQMSDDRQAYYRHKLSEIERKVKGRREGAIA